ncbi:hypothetical protein P154DRAFT_532262 [Amniculicola lignicola CBS 123094]|uniref:N-alpha-acetyltransferase 40 n=1 Tax=Amniculicola lignicola CBS 123094 TaxID=1392246 RepID=A0A6A5WR29_9PLEO|nr:hypothetical protein P154DRAFT_532262 [Amniculicola lignicola CBS 123094]
MPDSQEATVSKEGPAMPLFKKRKRPTPSITGSRSTSATPEAFSDGNLHAPTSAFSSSMSRTPTPAPSDSRRNSLAPAPIQSIEIEQDDGFLSILPKRRKPTPVPTATDEEQEIVSTMVMRRSSSSDVPLPSLELQEAIKAGGLIYPKLLPKTPPPPPIQFAKFCLPWNKHNWLPRDDPLLSFKTPSFPVAITYHLSSELSPNEMKACFALLEKTSSTHYKRSSMGWDPVAKQEEMREKTMMYLLVRRAPTTTTNDKKPPSPDTILGFLSLMYTYDDPPNEKRPVIYIYEIHLDAALRGAGLGSQLITIAETVAKRSGLSKTMLTVFSANKKALALYNRLGYNKDDCSPADYHLRARRIEHDYKILSKELVLEKEEEKVEEEKVEEEKILSGNRGLYRRVDNVSLCSDVKLR